MAIALGSVWLGLVVATMVDLPPSFFIVAVSTCCWLAALVFRRVREGRAHPAVAEIHHPVRPAVH